MNVAGFYFGAHPGCSLYGHHRHPLNRHVLAGAWESAPQPKEFTVTAKATVTLVYSVDLDGTVRVRDGGYAIASRDLQDALAQAESRIPGHQLAEWDSDEAFQAALAVLDAVADGELPTWENWPKQQQPILDPAEGALHAPPLRT